MHLFPSFFCKNLFLNVANCSFGSSERNPAVIGLSRPSGLVYVLIIFALNFLFNYCFGLAYYKSFYQNYLARCKSFI